MTMGEMILKLRKQQGISQEELAGKMYVSRQTVSQWETNQTAPSIENLIRLKEIFGVPIDQLICGNEAKASDINADSLDTVCAALAYAMGIQPPACAAEMNGELANYIDKIFDGQKADRVVMYNPDAVAEWVYQKYPEYLTNVLSHTDK
jgi:transcriptional regulator with XRE-family HTH domain